MNLMIFFIENKKMLFLSTRLGKIALMCHYNKCSYLRERAKAKITIFFKSFFVDY